MDTELDRGLAALRGSVASLTPPERVDRAIAAAIALDRNAAGTRWRGWREMRPAWFALSAAFAAMLAVVAIVGRDAMRPAAPAGETPFVARETGRAWFLPVVPPSELSQTDDAWVVSAQLSRITLAQFGLPIDPAQAAEVVDTELLIRADGALLAVRFVQ